MPKTINISVGVLAGAVLCALLLGGCSGEEEKKAEQKKPTVQEQMGHEAAQALKQPLEEARRTAAQAGAKADQALKEVPGDEQKAAGGEKKKLEGC